MDEHTPEEKDLHDLNEVMQAFGVSEWKNLGLAGPPGSPPGDGQSLLVEIQGERYVLKERVEGLIEDDSNHRYVFRHFLQQAGIPIPSLWLTPQGEPAVVVDDDYFEREQEARGERFSTANSRSLEWVGAAGAMLARIHQASSGYPGPLHRWPSEAHAGGVVQGYLNLARSKAEESEIAAIAAALSNWCDQWEAVLPSAMVSIGSVRGLPEFHIHGDFHAIELAYGLFYFSALEWRANSAMTRPLVKRGLDPERARSFLESYGAIYPPAPREASILGDALTLVSPIATINGPLEDIFFTPHGINDTLIDDVMERLAWAASLPAWLARVRRSLAEMWE